MKTANLNDPLSMPSPRKGACVLILKQEGDTLKLLTVSRPNGSERGMPGGKQEAGETAQENAVREVEEETGLRIPPESLTSLYRGPCPSLADPEFDVDAFWVQWDASMGTPVKREATVIPEWTSFGEYARVSAFIDFDARTFECLSFPVDFPKPSEASRAAARRCP